MATVAPEPSPLLALMRLQPGWELAAEQLRVLLNERTGRSEGVDGYAAVYAHARAAMVFDVVASHRRRYREVVVPAVRRFREQWPDLTLRQLADGDADSGLGLPPERWSTIKGVATGFEHYRADRPELVSLSDDALVADWAMSVEPVRLTPRLDPYVGAVSGIGIALFAYLRMRSGADGLKPDVRVRKHLARLGFPSPQGEAGLLLLLGEAVAEEAGISRLELDQLLW